MLTGPEWLVLQAVFGLPKDQYGNVHDAEIVSDTGLRLHEVAASLEAATGKGSRREYAWPMATWRFTSRRGVLLS